MNLTQSTSNISTPCAVIIDFLEIVLDYSPRTTLRGYLFENATPLVQLMDDFGPKSIIESILVKDYDNPAQRHVVWEAIEHRYWNREVAFWEHSESIETMSILIELISEDVDKKIKDALKPYGLELEYTNFLFHHWVGPTHALLTHKYYETML